jgi:hypothetical protein
VFHSRASTPQWRCSGAIPSRFDRVALEIELDHDRGLLADDPPVVPWLDRDGLRRGELASASVGITIWGSPLFCRLFKKIPRPPICLFPV